MLCLTHSLLLTSWDASATGFLYSIKYNYIFVFFFPLYVYGHYLSVSRAYGVCWYVVHRCGRGTVDRTSENMLEHLWKCLGFRELIVKVAHPSDVIKRDHFQIIIYPWLKFIFLNHLCIDCIFLQTQVIFSFVSNYSHFKNSYELVGFCLSI